MCIFVNYAFKNPGMKEGPLISVCIPAYKNIDFLQRLMDSIATQTFRDFEVVVTDDNPGWDVKALCAEYAARFRLRYFRNPVALGTPENWNEGVRSAAGEWIKIMHDDDWFAGPDSLAEYAAAVDAHPTSDFIFAAYRDVFLDTGGHRDMFLSRMTFKAFLRNRTILFGRNIIGAPSVTLYRRNPAIEYDRRIKWVVDIDFYMRYLQNSRPVYIDKILVNIGLGKEQVTQDCRKPEVEIPENFYLLKKVGVQNLANILVYDAWWRLLRNLGIHSKADIVAAGYNGPLPDFFLSMIRWQKQLPAKWRTFGPISKIAMFLNYLVNYHNIRTSSIE